MGLIYLDSNIIIYAFEDEGPRGDAVRARLEGSPGDTFAISPLVAMECLVSPARSANPVLLHYYEEGLALFDSLPLHQTVFRRAADLRAQLNLRTPDAIHLAAAQVHDCSALWTNDDRLAASSRGLAIDITNR